MGTVSEPNPLLLQYLIPDKSDAILGPHLTAPALHQSSSKADVRSLFPKPRGLNFVILYEDLHLCIHVVYSVNSGHVHEFLENPAAVHGSGRGKTFSPIPILPATVNNCTAFAK